MSRQKPLIFVVSGEPSGDILAGRLMSALKAETGGEIRFAGVGGPRSEAHGLNSLFPMRELSVGGFAEVLPHLPRLIRRLKQTAEAVRTLKPDAVVTIDSPSFTLRVAEKLRDTGIPVIHYVAPQLWAWRPGRAKKLARRVDHIMALLPFEVAFFETHGIPCTYVGHTAIESGAGTGDGPAFRARHGLPPDATVLCVVPGSRHLEIKRTLPIFRETLTRLKETYPSLHIVIPVAPSVDEEVAADTRDWPFPVVAVTDPTERYDAFAACDAALAKSGTVTLELALADVPTVVAYQISAVSAFIIRRIGVSVQHASLVNLLAGREVVPEFLQEDCTPEKLAAALDVLLSSEEARETQRKEFREVRDILGGVTPLPSERAAKVVLDLVRARADS